MQKRVGQTGVRALPNVRTSPAYLLSVFWKTSHLVPVCLHLLVIFFLHRVLSDPMGLEGYLLPLGYYPKNNVLRDSINLWWWIIFLGGDIKDDVRFHDFTQF